MATKQDLTVWSVKYLLLQDELYPNTVDSTTVEIGNWKLEIGSSLETLGHLSMHTSVLQTVLTPGTLSRFNFYCGTPIKMYLKYKTNSNNFSLTYLKLFISTVIAKLKQNSKGLIITNAMNELGFESILTQDVVQWLRRRHAIYHRPYVVALVFSITFLLDPTSQRHEDLNNKHLCSSLDIGLELRSKMQATLDLQKHLYERHS